MTVMSLFNSSKKVLQTIKTLRFSHLSILNTKLEHQQRLKCFCYIFLLYQIVHLKPKEVYLSVNS